MPSSQNPSDPLSDLRTSLDEDEPFFPSSGQPASAAPAAAPAPPAAAPGGPPPVPPPLPRKPPGKTGAFGTGTRQSGIFTPAGGAAPAQPPRPSLTPVPVTPSGGARAAGDPFREPPEPRPPRSGSPEEKIEYFRAVLKLKEETLTRGRQLFVERDAEAEKLRGLSGALKAQLDDALKQLEEARVELKANEEDRKDLSRALAETEAQVPLLKEQLEGERASRSATTEELKGAKEAMGLAQERMSELAARNSELGGDLEAVQEQYQVVSAENAKLVPELDRVTEELATVTAERNAAVADRDVTKEDLEAANARSAELEAQLTEAAAKYKTLEGEAEWAKSSLTESEKRLQGAQEAKGELEQRLAQGQAQAGKKADDLAQQLENEQARALGLEGERNEVADELVRLKQDLEATRQQARVQLDAEKKKIHEALTTSFTKKLTEADARFNAEEERRGELEARLAEAEGKTQALEEHSAASEREFQEKLSTVETGAVRKLRDELNQANKKAMEATAGLQKEKREREAAEVRLTGADRRAQALQSQVEALEQSVAHAQAQAPAPSSAAASGELTAERDKLKQDVANLKRKLVAAENAIEAAAAMKSKVARLEAELKKLKK